MKTPLIQSDGYPSACQVCGKEGNRTGNNYCSKLCQKKFGYIFFNEKGEQCCTKTDEEIMKLIK